MEDFLLRHFRPDHPRHLRIKPTNAVAANDKVGRVENVSSNKFQYQAIFGRFGSIKSNMNFEDPSLPSCIIPMVGS
jgi:hypothetical protein